MFIAFFLVKCLFPSFAYKLCCLSYTDLWFLYVLNNTSHMEDICTANIFPGTCVCMCTQLCLTLCLTPPLGSSVHGIFQTRILQQVAVSFSRGSSLLRGGTQVSCVFCISRRVLSQLSNQGSCFPVL